MSRLGRNKKTDSFVGFVLCVLVYGLLPAGAKYLMNSFISVPVASKILAMLLVDGQRGCPYFDQRLLLLNIVGSSPLSFARPEHETLWAAAKQSIAFHISP